MKNKLETELKDLARKIQDSNTHTAAELQSQARKLYEKLTILAFTEENLAAFSSEKDQVKESAGKSSDNEITAKSKEPAVSQTFSNGTSPERDDYLPDGTEYNDSEAITEPNTEKIKDIVAQMPPETQKLDFLVDDIFSQKNSAPRPEERKPEPVKEEPAEEEDKHEEPVEEEKKEGFRKEASKKEEPKQEEQKDFRDIGVDYDNLPSFEPVRKQQDKERPKSLNDRLKKGFNIGLNERLAFIRHLFEGNTSDYNRVISQLSTFHSLEEAKKFIQLVVKPDYKHWQGKEEYENKFMELVENKFGH